MPDRFTLDWVNGGTGRHPPESPPQTQVERPWAMPAQAVAAGLATDPAVGLTAEEAAARLQRVGPTSWSNEAASRLGGCWPSSSPTP
jgi:hypothetical protein